MCGTIHKVTGSAAFLQINLGQFSNKYAKVHNFQIKILKMKNLKTYKYATLNKITQVAG
jgi:hypothetical protein